MVMEPLTIAGALTGAFLNKLLPETVLVVSLVALISFTSYNTLTKAARMYRAETKALLTKRDHARVREDGTEESKLTRTAQELEENEDWEEVKRQALACLDNEDADDDNETEDVWDEMENGQVTSIGQRSDEDNDDSTFSSATDLKNKEELAKILAEERSIPMGNVQVLIVAFAVIFFISLINGAGTFLSPLGIRCGSPSF